jgi:FtsZ-interacting cell division protein ZipA
VSEAQLLAMTQTAHELASRFNGIASAPDVSVALTEADLLDKFCVEVDVLIGLNVVSHDGRSFAGASIADAAQQAGLTLNSAGVYQRRNEADEVVYALCNHENTPFSSDVMADLQTHGITLMFEVPRVADGVSAFAELAQFAQQLAQHLDGKLVDDNIRPLSPAGLEKIQTHLTQIYQRMENQDIPAGGRRALRLFN